MDLHWKLQPPSKGTDPGLRTPAMLSLKAGDRLTAAVLDVTRGTDALLAFGRFRAYARLPMPIAVGQSVRIDIEASASGLRMVMVPPKGHGTHPASGERLPVHLFEPIADKPILESRAGSLKPGQVLQARITGFEKDGLQLVDFGRFKAFAKIDIPVRQGQVVPLAVLQDGPSLTLALARGAPSLLTAGRPAPRSNGWVPESQAAAFRPTTAAATLPPGAAVQAAPSPAAHVQTAGGLPPTAAEMAVLRDRVQQLLDATLQPREAGAGKLPAATQTALRNLQLALTPAAAAGDNAALSGRIRDFVENSGIYFEKRVEQALQRIQGGPQPVAVDQLSSQPAIRDLMVKDLKPNLLILKQFLDNLTQDPKTVDRHMLEVLKNIVDRTVSHIEHQQIAAAEKPVDPSLVQAFSHLLFLPGHPRNARLKVYYTKQGREDDHPPPRVSLLLEMDRLGSVRADLWSVGRDLKITFFVQDCDVKAAIDAEHHRIGEMLSTTFDTVAVSVAVSEKKIADFDGEDLAEAGHRQVDLRL